MDSLATNETTLTTARTTSEAHVPVTIRSCVEQSVRRYLQDMGGHQAENLMELVMEEVERPLLREVMQWTRGNQSQAANVLGISRGTLRRKLAKYDL
ncbi:MAG: hypothetical protein DHS20C11_15600 [Lysobacteraceae bacterium]|nr:MAG: hypothetical protein DHS20C11_15600 [Xanthomonadaceae bacterium]